MKVTLLIKKYRKKAGLTQSACAEKSSLSLRFFQDVESGTRTPSLRTLYNIAKVLEIHISDLIRDDIFPKE